MARIVLNGGSSSWKCGVYDVAARAAALDAGEPLAEVRLTWSAEASDDAEIALRKTGGASVRRRTTLRHAEAVPAILDALAEAGFPPEEARSVGHRIVHGGRAFAGTTWLDDDALAQLRALEPFAPSHNPIELAAVAAVRARLPAMRQYAVFDTQFHRTLAPAAYVYPGPYAWLARDVRRYGFHGSSVAYATERVAAMLGRPVASTQVVVAHLGGGCSVSAVRAGASVDTSMGFTPLDGTMMATRSGAVDPAILIYLMREAARDGRTTLGAFASDLDRMLNRESGLLGISGRSGDLREVRSASEGGDERARLALDLFTHRLAATIGALLPSLERMDALVFTGGIGEHGAEVRAATCARLGFAGVAIDESANGAQPVDAELSAPGAAARTFVLTAREEWFIAREGSRLEAPAGPLSTNG